MVSRLSITRSAEPAGAMGHVGGAPDIGIAEEFGNLRTERALASRAKRAFDMIGGLAIFIALSPVILAAAAAIRLTSPGPVVFRQRRIGVGGQEFTLYKFRTMFNGVPEEAHRHYVTSLIRDGVGGGAIGPAVYKIAGDARVTAVGRLLRRTSLDELPQLLNVIRGDMSLVGPRPPIPYEVAAYEPWQFARLAVRPGITGLWQVSGRNRLTYNDMCKLDIEYIRTWSFIGDLRIVALTPWVMLANPGGAS